MNIKTPVQVGQFLDANMHLFEEPEGYYGDEANSFAKEANERWVEFPESLRVLWMAAWPYTQFTGNQTLPLVYKLMYDYSDEWISERYHTPNTKREVEVHRRNNMPVYSLETRHSAGEFDVVGTSLGYPPFFFNIIQQLKWSGIPIRWKDRVSCEEKYPLLLAGGSIYGNPLPWSPIMDIVFIGEAEEEENNPGMQSVFKDIEKAKQDGALYDAEGREQLLHDLAVRYEFLYIPRLIELEHDAKSKYVTGFKHKYDDTPRMIKKRVVWDMNSVPCINRAMIPFHDPTMGPGEIEVARGCPAHCVTKDSLVCTDSGLLYIDEVTQLNKVQSGDGFEDCKHWLDQGEQEVFEVKLINGMYVKATSEHVIKVVSDGVLQDRKVGNLDGSEFVPIRKGGAAFPSSYYYENGGEQILDELAAKIAGFIVGDGCFPRRNDTCVNIVWNIETKETEILPDIIEFCSRFGYQPKVVGHQASSKVRQVWIYNKEIRNFFDSMFEGVKHQVPRSIRMSPRTVLQAFLDGLRLADGDKVHYGTVCLLTTVNKRLAYEFGYAHLALGNMVSIIEADVQGSYSSKSRKRYLIVDTGYMNIPVKPETGLYRKTDGNYAWRSRKGENRKTSNVMVLREAVEQGLSFDLDIENYCYVPIKSVVSAGVQPVRDLTVANNPYYVANGISNHNCTFCAVTFRYAPYRERTVEYMVDNLAESVKYSGSNVAFPCSFEFGSYSRKKTLLKRLLTDVTDYVDTQSMRVDSIANDPDFTQVAGEAGMKQLVLGVEGNSQRLREFVNKGITEKDILQAAENAFLAGFNKIKLYMIADLPYENQDDTDEIVALCEKIVNLRDSMGVKAQIRCSWTPLLVEAQTPLQWFACTVDDKKLTGVYEGLRKLGVAFSLGKKTEVNYTYFTQLFHLCDDVAAEAIVDVVDESDAVYLGAVSRDTKEKLGAALAKRGVDFEHYFCAKPDDKVDSFVFPWDFIFIKTAKKYLHRLYKESVHRIEVGRKDKWEEGFIDRKGACYNGCDGCAGCEVKVYSPADMMKLWDYNDKEVELAELKTVDQTTTAQKVRLRLDIPAYRRFIPNITWQFLVRRAAFLADVPITKRTIKFSSDSIKWKDWSSGKVYVDFSLTKRVLANKEHLDTFLTQMQENMLYAKFEEVAIVGPEDDVMKSAEYNLYEIVVDREVPTIQKIIDSYHATRFWEVMMKEDKYRSGVERTRLNLKKFVRDVWAVKDGLDVKLKVLVRGKASPYDALRSLLHIREVDALAHIATRLDVFKEIKVAYSDFFESECVECGEPIPVNLFGHSWGQDLCPVCGDEAAGILVARRKIGVGLEESGVEMATQEV